MVGQVFPEIVADFVKHSFYCLNNTRYSHKNLYTTELCRKKEEDISLGQFNVQVSVGRNICQRRISLRLAKHSRAIQEPKSDKVANVHVSAI